MKNSFAKRIAKRYWLLLVISGLALIAGCRSVFKESKPEREKPLATESISTAVAASNSKQTLPEAREWSFDNLSVVWQEVPSSNIPGEITFSLVRDGKVSLAVYKKDGGKMLRELLRGADRQAGKHSVSWDGRDRFGQPVPPGTYEWKLLFTEGFPAEFIMRLGINPPSAIWDSWVGDHLPVTAIASDETGLYLASYFSESSEMIIKQTLDGKQRLRNSRQWYDGNELQSLGIADNKLFGLTRSGNIRQLNRETLAIEQTWPLYKTPPGAFINPNDLAARGSILAVTDVDKNAIHVLNSQNGRIKYSIPVTNPQTVEVSSDGSIFVGNENSILQIPPNARTARVAIENLLKPQRIAIDPKNGNIFVAEGDGSFQIKKFDKNFRLLATFGRQGGRLPGLYNPADFISASDLLADGNGNVFIVEPDLPKRVALVNGKDGSILSEWFGGHAFFNAAYINSIDPSDVWFESRNNGLIRMKVDYDRKTWNVHSVYNTIPSFGGAQGGSPYIRWFIRHAKGNIYLVSSDLKVFKVDEKNRQLRAVVFTEYDHHAKQATVWTDINENLQRDEGEVKTYSTYKNISWIEGNWNLIMQPDWEKTAYYTLEFGGWIGANRDIPSWDLTQLKPGPELPPELLQNPDYGALYRDGQGSIHQTRGAMRMPGDERHGNFWPANELAIAKILKWDANGNLLHVASRSGIDGRQRGVFFQPGAFVGEVKGMVVYADRAGQPPGVVFDKEGLYAGTFADSRVDDGLPDWVYQPWKRSDHNGGQIFTRPNGDVIWLVQAENHYIAFKIHGWDKVIRQKGTVQILESPPKLTMQGIGLTGTYFLRNDFRQSLFDRLDDRVRFGSVNMYDPGKPWNLLEPLKPESFSVRWNGFIEIPRTEDYQFSVTRTGAVKVWIDGKIVIEASRGSGVVESLPMRLIAGSKIPVKIEFQSGSENPLLHFHWESLIQDRLTIPTTALYPN